MDETNNEGGKKPARASAAAVARRVEEILRVILDGAEEGWDLCEFVREKEKEPGSAWELAEGEKPLSYSQIRRYVVKADALIAESCRASRKKLLRRHLAKRRNLYAKAVSQGDVKAALSVLRDEAELLGIYAPKKIAPTTPDGKEEYGALNDAERLVAVVGVLRRFGVVAPAGPGGDPATGGGQADGDGPALGGPDPPVDAGGHDA